MNILFVSITDPSDQKATSGIFYSMYKALSVKHNVKWIGPVHFRWWEKIWFISLKILSKMFSFTYPKENSLLYSKLYAKNTRIQQNQFDIIFSPISSSLIANLDVRLPLVYFSDATFELLDGYYNTFSKIPKRYRNEGNQIEKLAIKRSSEIIFTSEWAKNSAISYYQADPTKISVIDFGANLQVVPAKSDLLLEYPSNSVLNLLFIGVNWDRKGGDIVISIFQKLQDMGVTCRLTIVGCVPPKTFELNEKVVVIPFLDKNNTDDFKKLYSIWLQSHIFILPTRADCTPVVFSEAASFGVPVFTTNTGGISRVICHEKTGYLFDINDNSEDYVNKITEIWADKTKYLQLRKNCREEYDSRLSWDIWAQKVDVILKRCRKNK